MKYFSRNKFKVSKASLEIEPEEIFMDALNSPGFRREMQEGRIERPIPKSYFIIFGVGMILVFSAVLWRMFDLQILRGSQFFAQAQANKTYPIIIDAPRGIIYDRNFEKLVENTPTFVISMNLSALESDDDFRRVFEKVNELSGKTAAEVAEANSVNVEGYSNLYKRSVWPAEIFIASGELREAILEIQSHPEDFPGVSVAEADLRKYTLGALSTHILGYVGLPRREDLKANKDLHPGAIVGKSGIELQYEDFLRGRAGEKLTEVNAAGEALRERYIVRATPGENVVLEIDADLQRFASETLERHIKAAGKKAGAVVVIDPRDGAVRALASSPSYDPSIFGRGSSKKDLEKLLNDPDHPFYNRAISAGYPSGSTIKPIMATAALEEKIIDPLKSIYDPGYISIPNPFDPANPTIFKDWKELGWVDMRRALAMSANVYFYTIGGGYHDIKGLGIARIKKFLSQFGWGSVLGIDLPGENAGFLPDPENKKQTRPKDPTWRIGDTYITSIGQGDIQATPLQLAASTAAIANGGTLWRPRLAKAIVDEEKNAIHEFKPEIIRSGLAKPESLEVVREGMRQAVTDGSAKALNDLFFTTAGKTGTAQTGVYGKNHGWFIGFAPYENPEIAIAVLVEEGTGGSTDAVPIAKEVLYRYFTAKKGAN